MPRIIRSIRGKKGMGGTWLVLSENHFLLLPDFPEKSQQIRLEKCTFKFLLAYVLESLVNKQGLILLL